MSKPVNHSLIGVFVLGALALIVVAFVAFGSFTFTKRSYPFIIYVTDSLNGLTLNSDVKFKGVKIGKVQQILVHFQEKSRGVRAIPVVIEIDEAFVRDGRAISDEEVKRRLLVGVEQGLRARIQQANLLTGMLYVELDYFPGTPAVVRGAEDGYGYPEIPTITSNMSQMLGSVARILENLSQIDFKSFSGAVEDTFGRLNAGIDAIEFEKINANVVAASESAKKLLADPRLHSVLDNAERLTRSAAAFSERIDADFGPVAGEFRTAVNELRATLEEIDATAATLRSAMTGARGSLREDFADTLEQLAEAARSVRAFADYLQSNPSALVFGAPEEKQEK
ncbi:MAG: MlaD family protein [Candidatus Spyradosoma sp.]